MVGPSHRPLERSVAAFDADTSERGGYVYTTNDRWSSQHAGGRQTDEVIRMLAENFPRSIRLADIGCGDGTHSLEIFRLFGPAGVRGIDPASNAIAAAQKQIPSDATDSVAFEVGNIYDVESKGEDVAVIFGVLHHLDRPQLAINHLASQFKSVLVLEPNGFNPALKVIEKVSAYHREHDEKSYWPPALNRWFAHAGMSVVAQKYFCLVPYFFPTSAAKALAKLEPRAESTPLIRQVTCGTNLILYQKP
ncbi:MAG: class I SAM-dependent methyltransferase [Mycobacterium sp.]|uniref:class I SAM-dependent methyltransferase n=1 Tax=Mycobacterium sp. TaxID=1785 RepID=UPI001EB1C431|nr:class I SAM-dependent methyltransferase [Mycobacterium sp.]MBW0017774.1 class I SAM-dependent methyltransferase [Mycobacterium sp.]